MPFVQIFCISGLPLCSLFASLWFHMGVPMWIFLQVRALFVLVVISTWSPELGRAVCISPVVVWHYPVLLFFPCCSYRLVYLVSGFRVFYPLISHSRPHTIHISLSLVFVLLLLALGPSVVFSATAYPVRGA